MDETSAILKYPEGSSYASAKGYLNNLNADQDEALSAIQIWIIDNNIEIKALSSCTLHPTLLLLRYLRANSFNVEKTIHHITSNLKWREDQKITSDILVKRPEDILGVNSMDQITSIFPHWHLNYDRLGRPVIYKQYGSFDVARLLKVTSIDALMKYHIWEQEMCMEMCYRQSLKNGHIVETVTAVLDVKGMTLSQVTSDFLNIVKGIAKIDQQQYPETLGRFFIINCPSMFPFVWKGVKMFLDPVVTSKIEIFGPKESEWKKRLFEFIGEKNLPSNYGGQLAALDFNRHPYEEILALRDLDSPKNAEESPLHMSETEAGAEGDIEIRPRRPSLDKSQTLSPKIELKELSAIYRGWSQEINFANHILQSPPNAAINVVASGNGSFQRWTTKSLKLACKRCILLHIGATLVCIIMSGWQLGSMNWDDSTALAVMWTSIVILFSAAFVAVVELVGYIAIGYENRPLLLIYTVSLNLLIVLLFCMTLVTFLNASNVVGTAYLPTQITTDVLTKLWEYNIVLGIGCLLVVSVGIIPIIMVYLLNNRLKHDAAVEAEVKTMRDINIDNMKRNANLLKSSSKQLRTIIKLISAISMLIAVIMLCYGTYALNFLQKVNFMGNTFDLFGLIYGGTLAVLVSLAGFWTAHTSRKGVVVFYWLLAIPTLCGVLLYVASISIRDVPHVSKNVNRAADYNQLHLDRISGFDSSSSVIAVALSQLLVTGTVCIFLCVIQFISFFAARNLDKNLRFVYEMQDCNDEILLSIIDYTGNRDVKTGHLPSICTKDRIIIVWGFTVGLYCIFSKGTYVIFSTWPGTLEANEALLEAWQKMGRYDTQYLQSDNNLLTIFTILAVIVGPLSLMYSWAVIERHKSRHLSGLIASVLLMYSQVLYYALESRNSFKDFSLDNLAAFVTVFIIINVLHLIFPAVVITIETNAINHVISMASKHDQLLQQSVSSRAPLLFSSQIQRRAYASRSRDYRKGSGSSTAARRRRSFGSTGSMSESNFGSISLGVAEDSLSPSAHSDISLECPPTMQKTDRSSSTHAQYCFLSSGKMSPVPSSLSTVRGRSMHMPPSSSRSHEEKKQDYYKYSGLIPPPIY